MDRNARLASSSSTQVETEMQPKLKDDRSFYTEVKTIRDIHILYRVRLVYIIHV